MATITINNPVRLNALNSATLNELYATIRTVAADDAIRAIIVTGAGDGQSRAADALAEGAGVLNVSDLMLDRHDLLARVQARTGCPHPLPPRAEAPLPGRMATCRLRRLGWRPGGLPRLDAFLDAALR